LMDDMGEDGTYQILLEVTHQALCHPQRRGAITCGMNTLEPVFDIAATMAVTGCIANDREAFVRPKDMQFPEGLSAEEYFNLLLDKLNKDGKNLDDITGDADSPSDAYAKMLKEMGIEGKTPQDHSRWSTVSVADQQAFKQILLSTLQRQRGTLPMGMQRLLDMLKSPPQVRWQDRLRRVVGNKITAQRKKWTYKKLSRRFGDGHPGTKRMKRGDIAVDIDTSGSMTEADVSLAVNEIKGIADAFGATFILTCGDTEVQKIHCITGKQDLKNVKIHGGGGTSHVQKFEFLSKRHVDLAIFFTDLCTEFPPKAPKFQVIWVTHTDIEPPFGETFRIKSQ
jgi:predicted metal-dependent peptidase